MSLKERLAEAARKRAQQAAPVAKPTQAEAPVAPAAAATPAADLRLLANLLLQVEYQPKSQRLTLLPPDSLRPMPTKRRTVQWLRLLPKTR